MIKLERKWIVRKPVRQVFSFLGDLENMPQFDQQIIRVSKVSEEPIGPGTVYREESRALGWRTETTVQIAEYVPDKKITFKREGPGFDEVQSWEFQPALGSTRIISKLEHQPKGTFKASEPIDALILKHGLDDRISSLKRILESKRSAS